MVSAFAEPDQTPLTLPERSLNQLVMPDDVNDRVEIESTKRIKKAYFYPKLMSGSRF